MEYKYFDQSFLKTIMQSRDLVLLFLTFQICPLCLSGICYRSWPLSMIFGNDLSIFDLYAD